MSVIPSTLKRINDRKSKATLNTLAVSITFFFSEYRRYRKATKKEINIPKSLKRLHEVIDSGDYQYAEKLAMGLPIEKELGISIGKNNAVLKTNPTVELKTLIEKMEKVLTTFQDNKPGYQVLLDKIKKSEKDELHKHFK